MQHATYSGRMGRHIPRTSADELADARKALDAAFAEMANWRKHLETMASRPGERDGVAHQARRSAKIVGALIDEAGYRTREADRVDAQLKSVS